VGNKFIDTFIYYLLKLTSMVLSFTKLILKLEMLQCALTRCSIIILNKIFISCSHFVANYKCNSMIFKELYSIRSFFCLFFKSKNCNPNSQLADFHLPSVSPI
jgi:hypothetical protein